MSKLNLEEKLGVTINSFAYPFGEINDNVVRLTSSYGYKSAVGLGILSRILLIQSSIYLESKSKMIFRWTSLLRYFHGAVPFSNMIFQHKNIHNSLITVYLY